MKLEEIAFENILANMTPENALGIVQSIPETIIQNKKNIHDWTLLHRVAEVGSSEAVKYLVDNGFELDASDQYGKTPLHRAAVSNHHECIVILVNKGANVNALDNYGATALHLAAQGGNAFAVKALIDAKSDVNAKTSSNLTSLLLAARVGAVECVGLLLKADAKADSLDEHGRTALDWVSADLKSARAENPTDSDRIDADQKMIDLLKEYEVELAGDDARDV